MIRKFQLSLVTLAGIPSAVINDERYGQRLQILDGDEGSPDVDRDGSELVERILRRVHPARTNFWISPSADVTNTNHVFTCFMKHMLLQ
jgi:hypothetical protein